MIEMNNICKIYNQGKENEFHALKNISLHVEQGEFLIVVGKSGAGKTTLLNILGCIDTFTSGEYFLEGKSLEGCHDKEKARIRNEKIGIVMQEYALIEEYTALENVEIPLYFGKCRNRKEKAMKAMEQIGIGELADRTVSKLSGGQRQRVAVSRAIVNQPCLLLADEPTGALDSGTSVELMEVFKELNGFGITIIMITHDRELAKQYGTRVVEIIDGRISAS